MNTANTVFLGLVATATVVMAVVQIGMVVMLIRLTKRVEQVSQRVEHEIGPLAERLTKVAEQLQQASSLATVQVERVDRMLSSLTRRAEETMSVVQGAVVGPLREGLAVIAAIRGVVGAFRSFRGGESGPRELPGSMTRTRSSSGKA